MKRLALALIRFYRKYVSPMFPPSCRYDPTCSKYALEAIEVHGVVRGSLMAVWRILRCNPFHECGYDPVPPKKIHHGQEFR